MKSCHLENQKEAQAPERFSWRDRVAWRRASRNTLNCLIGCSIGDFGTIIWFQTYHPEIPLLRIIPLAMVMGICTSILFEALILKFKEGFPWIKGIKTAFSMSFLSMLGMELAENATDYYLTRGEVSPSEPFYWVALGIALIAGFIVPLPYNYYQFKKHGKACH